MCMYYVHFGYISCYVRNLFFYIHDYIGISVFSINCYVTCYITYCVGVLKTTYYGTHYVGVINICI